MVLCPNSLRYRKFHILRTDNAMATCPKFFLPVLKFKWTLPVNTTF